MLHSLVYSLSRKTTSTALTVALAMFLYVTGAFRKVSPVTVLLVAVLAAASVGATVAASSIFADGIQEGWKSIF